MATYGNSRQTHVLVLSDQDQRENIRTLENREKADKITFLWEPLAGAGWDGKIVSDEQTFVKRLKSSLGALLYSEENNGAGKSELDNGHC